MATVNKRDMKPTAKQIALVHVAKKELGFDDENYRSILDVYGGVNSAKDLTLEGFERVMRYFEHQGFHSAYIQENKNRQEAQKAPYRDPSGSPYPAQLKMIEQLFKQVGIPPGERQQGFCRRVIQQPWPQTRAEANKIFEALKAMLARGYKAE